MGRFAEQAKQKLHMTSLKGTPNARNEQMLAESNNFLHVLKETEKVVLKLKTHGSRFFTHTQKAIAQLPHTYDLDPNTGKASPVVQTHTFTAVGNTLPKDYISSASGATEYTPEGGAASGVYLEATSAGTHHVSAPVEQEVVQQEGHVAYPEHFAPGTPGASPVMLEGERFEDAQPVMESGIPEVVDANYTGAPASVTTTTTTAKPAYAESPMAAEVGPAYTEGSIGPSTPRSFVGGSSSGGLVGGGHDVRQDHLSTIATNFELRLDNEVLKPIHGWMKKHEKTKGDLKKAEKVRLDLDAARRQFYNTEMKHVKQQKALKPTEQLERDLAAHEAALNVATQRWNDTESAMYMELADLINEARQLRTYMARAMVIAEEAFHNASWH